MNVQGKLGSYGGYSTTEGFVEELQKHFKINKVCDNANLIQCFDDKITMNGEEIDMTNIKTAEGFGQPDWGTNIIGLQVADGTTALVAYNPQCKANPYDNTITGTECVAIVYDTSGFSGPNEMLNDVQKNASVKSLSGKSCAFEIGGTCFGVPFKPTALSKADCESLKSSLNITTCLSDNDYWAGAAKECKGTGNMATQADLNKLANALYNTTGITGDKDNITLDTTKAGQYGFKESTFYVWSGEENLSNAHDRWFYSSATVSTGNQRTSSDHYAVCITK